jgi:hypothetical protein
MSASAKPDAIMRAANVKSALRLPRPSHVTAMFDATFPAAIAISPSPTMTGPSPMRAMYMGASTLIMLEKYTRTPFAA